ncbi:MAG TPA: hypothetical protein VH253_04525 [Phycisphaerae bacterium]|nr:hypothetical protein [Phycisphaerae bacterium]
MRSPCLSALPFFLAALAGCSVYHPLRNGVGFTDTPVGPDSYQITYVGPEDMPIAESRDYALLRAAELAALRDDPYFQILNEQGYVSQGMQYWPGEDVTYFGGFAGRWHRYPVVYHAWAPGYFEPYTVPQYTLTVRVTPQPLANVVPANYLIQRAADEHIKLSPGVLEKSRGMPTAVPATMPATQP